MTQAIDIKKQVISIIEEITTETFPSEKIDASLRDELGLDSMDFLEIVVNLRDKFDIDLPSADYSQLETLESTISYIQKHTSK